MLYKFIHTFLYHNYLELVLCLPEEIVQLPLLGGLTSEYIDNNR